MFLICQRKCHGGGRADSFCFSDVSGHRFDISALRNNFSDYNAADFALNVCGPIIDRTICKSSTDWMICQVYSQIGLGTYSSATASPLDIPGQGFLLNVDHGVNGRSSDIRFICDPDVDVGHPVYDGKDFPLYHFTWKTMYACYDVPCIGAQCSSCLADASSCLWCLDSNECSTHANFDPSCKNWVSDEKFCPGFLCSQFSTCQLCTQQAACGWCLTSDTCLPGPLTPDRCADAVQNSTYCPTGATHKLQADADGQQSFDEGR